MSTARKTAKSTTAKKTTTTATEAKAAPARPPFTIDPLVMTGTCATGDLIENLLDEVRVLLFVASELSDQTPELASILAMASRKADAAAELYDNLEAVRALTKAAA